MIYLDHNATTPLADEATEAMARCRREAWANPASQHAAGRRARRWLEEAREGVAELLGANLAGPRADRLLFTSGGTEANCLAVLGCGAAVFGGATGGQMDGSDALTRRTSSPAKGVPVERVPVAEQPHHIDAPHALVSGIEHPSVVDAAAELARRGWQVERVRTTADGIVDLADLESRLRPATRLVSVMLGNNETGVLQPVGRVVETVRWAEQGFTTEGFTTETRRHGDGKGVKAAVSTPTRRGGDSDVEGHGPRRAPEPHECGHYERRPASPPGANRGTDAPRSPGMRIWVHTDAVQVVGKGPVDFRGLGVDMLSASGHKFHGPRGVGLLVLRHDVPISPLLHGGFQQEGLRPGTEPVELAVGLHAALAAAMRDRAARAARMAALRERFEAALLGELPGIVIHGAAVERLPHTSNIAFVGCDRQALFIALDLAGVACSTGSACASGSSEPSPVLAAMGLPAELSASSLRFSLGAGTTADEVDQAAAEIARICRDFLRSAGVGKTRPDGRVGG